MPATTPNQNWTKPQPLSPQTQNHFRLSHPTFFAAGCADFQRGPNPPTSTWPEVKYGIGPYPCWGCGTDQHSLPACPRRHKNAKCGVCGSMAHLSRDCAQRFYPDPRWASLPPRPPPQPRPVATFPNNIPLSNPSTLPPQTTPNATQPFPPITPTPIPPPQPTTPSNPTPNTPPIKASLQAAQAWPNLWGSLATTFPPTSLSCAQPVPGPPGTQQLHYNVLFNGFPALALMDPGASHSFVHPKWMARYNQSTTQLAVPYSLGTFVGAEHKVNTTLTASLSIVGVSRPWDFLVIDRMPAEVVLGLDLMLYWPMFINPVDRCLYVPPQHISHPPNWFTPAKNTPPATPTLRALFSSLTINPSLSPRDTLSPIVSSNHQGVTASGSEEAEELNTFLDNAPPPLKTVVSKHLSLFKPPDRDPPDRPVKHFIQVPPDCVPAARQPYPLAEIKLQALRAQMRELIDKGWVLPSSSPWAAPILFVAKDNSSKLRMCVDFRDLNALTKKNRYPLPRLD